MCLKCMLCTKEMDKNQAEPRQDLLKDTGLFQ